jgi:long-chain fatty acid transport protein
MKKISLLFVSALILSSNTVMGQMDNLVNMSAEWVRSSARNAATDAADIVVYNPAGLTKLENGFHINAGNQFVFRKPSHQYDIGMGEGMKEFEQQSSDPFLPNLYMTYKNDNWAAFAGAFISGGGATVDYSKGSITTDLIGLQGLMMAQGAYMQVKDQTLEASSMYLTYTAGGSYAFNDKISAALAIRYITAKNTMTAGMTMTSSPYDLPDIPMALDAEFNAAGIGEVISICVTPIKHLAITARYETQVKLDFKTKTTTDDFGATVDNERNRRDLPGVLAFGVALDVTNRFKVIGDYNYYMQENANWGKSSDLTMNTPLSKLAGNATAYAMGMEYKISDNLMVSAGAGYTDFDYNNKEGYYTSLGTFEVVPDDNLNVNAGFVFKPVKMLAINAGFMQAIYKKDQHVNALMAYPMEVDVTTNNAISIASIGLNVSF